MTRRASILIALVCLMAATASAQDVRSVLQASAKAMGLTNLKTIQYSGSGWFSLVGQTYGLNEDWPHYEVNPYTRTIDYDAKFSREEYTRRQGNYPTLGRVPMPEQHIVNFLNGTSAWNVEGDKVVPQTRPYLDGAPVSDLRQLNHDYAARISEGGLGSVRRHGHLAAHRRLLGFRPVAKRT